MWGVIPAAGIGSRIQPLAFSKELLPVGVRFDGATERPKAVSEYLVERMIRGGATKLCFVISPGKSDIVEYYGGSVAGARICYVVQERPAGLCDAIFRAEPFVADDEPMLVGLPDTVWFPEDGFGALPVAGLSFLLFRVEQPQCFDVVVTDARGAVEEVQVKPREPRSDWIWGAFKMTGAVLRELRDLWLEPGRRDEYVGTLVDAWLERGGRAVGVKAGEAYVDTGTLHGYHHAMQLLRARAQEEHAALR